LLGKDFVCVLKNKILNIFNWVGKGWGHGGFEFGLGLGNAPRTGLGFQVWALWGRTWILKTSNKFLFFFLGWII